ncbi:MAG: SDR family oxidoreductase [Chloroflexi bacterium]|nr:SDR family oxidoreductase [Chloroflexota bacterium]
MPITPGELKGKVAVVVGASRGIGKAYALALGQAGATVVAVARSAKDTSREALHQPKAWGKAYGARQVEGLLPGSLEETVAEVQKAGGQATPVRCDIAKEDEVEAMARVVLRQHGHVDIVVNNAAVYPRYGNWLDITTSGWDASMDVNVRGPFLILRALAPSMIARKSGSIINITTGGSAPVPMTRTISRGLLLYVVSKAALDRMTYFLADELAPHNIAVNLLSPGTIVTEGMRDAAPPGYPWENDPEGFKWEQATPEYLGPALIHLAKQSAATLTRQSLRTDQFGQTWGKG